MSRAFLYFLLGFCGGLWAVAAPIEVQNLIKDSPFLPPGFREPSQRPAAPVARQEPERPPQVVLRGVMRLNGEYRFRLHDKADNVGMWLKEGQRVEDFPFMVTNFDNGTATVNADGRILRLTLEQPSFANNPPVSSDPNASVARPAQVENRSEEASDRQERPVRRRVIVPRRR